MSVACRTPPWIRTRRRARSGSRPSIRVIRGKAGLAVGPNVPGGWWEMHLLGFLIMGAVAGWLAGKIMSGHGYGIIWDVVLGVLGSFVGGFVVSLIGAVVLVAIVHMIKREPMRTV